MYATASSASNPVRKTALQYGTGVRHIIRGVKVSGGSCTFSIVAADGSPTTHSLAGDIEYTPSSEYEFLHGGDFSRLNMMLEHGVKYKENNTVKDAVQIAVDNGWNIVRLRIYNDPGNASYKPSGYMTKGYVNTEDALELARKAKDKGLKVLLTFHYSDYWSDPSNQYIPHEWEGKNEAELKTAIYEFTYDVLSQMKSQSTLPEYVSVGNEINCGMLFGSYSNANSYYCKYDKFVAFFNQGAKAVRDISDDIKVVVHATNPTRNIGWLFDHMENYNADYDVIGLSYYPYWTDASVQTFVQAADGYADTYGKEVLIMETGYNWSTVTSYGDSGQLEDNGPYDAIYGTSEEAQRNYLLELSNEIKKSDSVIGFIYWDPLTVPLKSFTGMNNTMDGSSAPNHDNGTVTQNSSLFDFSGNRLAAWDAFKYNN